MLYHILLHMLRVISRYGFLYLLGMRYEHAKQHDKTKRQKNKVMNS